ncbi:MAG: DUF1735 domain-containing protein [Tannerella sp.]|jgi:hypothetical protein|nr:DUF1735 domain-containing protein [Tannerella sp.]
MKKSLFLIIAGILLMFTSCEDNRSQNFVPDKVYLVKTGLLVEESFDTGEKVITRLWANKSGLNNIPCTVTYSIDAVALAQYNAENETVLEVLPADCYSITQYTFRIEGNEQYAKFQIEYDPTRIAQKWEDLHSKDPEFSKYGTTNFVLPVTISSDGVEAIESQKSVLLQFEVNEPMIRAITDNFDVIRVFEDDDQETIERQVEFGMSFVNRWDGAVSLETDRQALKLLVNEARGKIRYTETRLKSKTAGDTEEFSNILTHIDGVLPPADAYTLSDNLSVQAGVNTITVVCTINKSKLHPGLNIIPVKLTGVPEPLKTDPQKNICYIPVQYVPNRSKIAIKSSSSHQSADYSPVRIAGVFDGDFDTSWRPGVGSASYPSGIGNDNRPAIVVDLGAETDVTAVELWTRGDGQRQGSRTETYSGGAYIQNLKIHVSSDDQCWEEANGEFLLQGTALITAAKSYWGNALLDYNWKNDNPDSAPCTLTLPTTARGRYVIIWYGENKRANQADIWELFIYGLRQ